MWSCPVPPVLAHRLERDQQSNGCAMRLGNASAAHAGGGIRAQCGCTGALCLVDVVSAAQTREVGPVRFEVGEDLLNCRAHLSIHSATAQPTRKPNPTHAEMVMIATKTTKVSP